VSLDALPNFATSSKIGPDFSKKVVLKIKLPKNHFNKKCPPKILFFNEKNQEDLVTSNLKPLFH
jgi:hypothetical protein